MSLRLTVFVAILLLLTHFLRCHAFALTLVAAIIAAISAVAALTLSFALVLLIASATVVSLLFLLIEARNAVLTYDVAIGAHLLFALVVVGQEFFGTNTVLVERYHLKHAFCRECHQIGGYRLVGRVSDFALEDICLEVEIGVILSFEAHFTRRQRFACLYVAINLKIDTTLQFSALTCKLLRV